MRMAQRRENGEATLAIVGGGAAGMFAAVRAAQSRIPCVLIERKARLGSKVLMTANGRCNFTKDIPPDRFLSDIERPPRPGSPAAQSAFLRRAISALPPRRVISFFRALGVRVKAMPDGRMFPADGKAATIVHAFGDALRNSSTPIITNCPVRGVSPLPGGGFAVDTANFAIRARNVLIATGGVSYPKLGSVGDGQDFAKSLGHRIVPYRPGLIGLETRDPRIVRRAGRRFENATARVVTPDGREAFSYRGELDCESFGLSGAAIYNCQRMIEHAGLGDYTLVVRFDGEEMEFRGLRPRPLKEAIVTLGGVALDDVNPATMESRLTPGLYFAGEVLDIDGPTGGYNLTLAFATASAAVEAVVGRK